MSIHEDVPYVGLAVLAVRDVWGDAGPEPGEIVGIVGLGDYNVRFSDGEIVTVNEADIYDTDEGSAQ